MQSRYCPISDARYWFLSYVLAICRPDALLQKTETFIVTYQLNAKSHVDVGCNIIDVIYSSCCRSPLRQILMPILWHEEFAGNLGSIILSIITDSPEKHHAKHITWRFFHELSQRHNCLKKFWFFRSYLPIILYLSSLNWFFSFLYIYISIKNWPSYLLSFETNEKWRSILYGLKRVSIRKKVERPIGIRNRSKKCRSSGLLDLSVRMYQKV